MRSCHLPGFNTTSFVPGTSRVGAKQVCTPPLSHIKHAYKVK